MLPSAPGKTSKSDRGCKATLGTILSEEKGCFLFRHDPADRAGRGEGARRQRPGPGTAGGGGEQRKSPKLSRQRSAAREQAGDGRAVRCTVAPGFRRAAPSRAPARKEACLRAGKGREAAGRSAEPPRTETAGGAQRNTKDLRGAPGRERLQSMLLKVVAPAQAGEEP
ncbi:hypothetical protein NN561_007638 [Cricetulus griseus]